MKIPKEAIEKAVQGGWKPRHSAQFIELNDGTFGDHSRIQFGDHITLDPSFWQFLGKALGWEGELKMSAEGFCLDEECNTNGAVDESARVDVWFYYAHAFYDLILNGGDTDAFWVDILKA